LKVLSLRPQGRGSKNNKKFVEFVASHVIIITTATSTIIIIQTIEAVQVRTDELIWPQNEVR
jgi:hypothetical protein